MEISFRDLGAVFQQVFDLPAEERQTCLDALCPHDQGPHDQGLRKEVESLLLAHDLAESCSDRELDFTLTEPGDECARRFGPYQVIGLLGEGGMGKVFLAERADQEFEQRVAIKTLRGCEKESCERFRAERQLLASLEHPGIARLYGGGSEDGLPYLVMEHIAGSRPIDQYCDELELDVAARLGIFLAVLDAVAYAHRQGILHLDLKPGNILVTPGGQPRLLDFGIAQRLGAESPVAGKPSVSRLALTPAYASPEQLLGGSVSPATDVFGLGVLLFTLLVGRPPFARSLEERLRQLGEQESRSSLATLARDSGQHPAARVLLLLDRQRLAALERILATALAPAKAGRYSSVEALALEVENLRADLRAKARRQATPSAFGDWLKRHWLEASLGGAGLLFLAVFTLSQRPAGRERGRQVQKSRRA